MLNVHSLLQERCVVHEIGSSIDYRKMASGEQGFYLVGRDLSGFLKQKFQQLIGEATATPQEVEVVMGRTLHVPSGANGCAYFFFFEELCDKPLGVADYFGLFKKFHTLALDGIPVFGLHNKSAAHRAVELFQTVALPGGHENRGELRIHESLDELRTNLANYIAELSEASMKERGVFAIACFIWWFSHWLNGKTP